MIDRTWAKENLEKIFPKNNQHKFNAAWLTYINFASLPLEKEVVDRFKKLWDWRVENSKTIPISINEYDSFKWWYKSGLFDRKWAIKHMLESTKKAGEKKRPEIFIVGDRLFEDLQNYPKTTWEIFKLVIKVEGYFMDSDINFVRQVFELIEKSDWSEIKKEAGEVKDEFCRRNKLDEKFVSIYL